MAANVNLFAGGGGLALGLKLAGYKATYLYEIDETAQETLKRNRLSKKQKPDDWETHLGDVTKVDWKESDGPVKILAAGVPCQPFSLGGKHLAQKDGRNHFPELLRAVRHLKPKIVVAENVQGLLRKSFRPYFDYIISGLQDPSLAPKVGETWQSHLKRLKKRSEKPRYRREYTVTWALLNAADYGVPQLRKRVFIVAIRGAKKFTFPTPTHSRTALVHSMLSGKYWKEHQLKKPSGLKKRFPDPPAKDELVPWVTVRDVLKSLPTAAADEESASKNGAPHNHWRIPGARSYAGHSGSDRDWPAKTVKAGVHGVPGGENTVRLGEKRVRYLTLREAASIQSFPLGHSFEGARLKVTKQIGNAVPPLLASVVIKAAGKLLANKKPKKKGKRRK